MTWRPTPKSDRFAIQRYNRETGEWRDCEFETLRTGDVYAAFAPDGMRIDPLSGEGAGPEICALATIDARRNETFGQGYEIAVVVGPLDHCLHWASN